MALTMSGPILRIITNNKESGDWIIVVLDGEEIYSGHSIGTCHLADILNTCNGFEYLYEHSLTDEQIEDWEQVIYGG